MSLGLDTSGAEERKGEMQDRENEKTGKEEVVGRDESRHLSVLIYSPFLLLTGPVNRGVKRESGCYTEAEHDL